MKKRIEGVVIIYLAFLFIMPNVTPPISKDFQYIAAIDDGKILYVGGSGPNNYTSIQDALNEANEGDTIFVYNDSSPYYENLIINKSIKLIGENRDTTIIDGRGRNVVEIIANGHMQLVHIP
jgi:hypothetical protein